MGINANDGRRAVQHYFWKYYGSRRGIGEIAPWTVGSAKMDGIDELRKRVARRCRLMGASQFLDVRRGELGLLSAAKGAAVSQPPSELRWALGKAPLLGPAVEEIGMHPGTPHIAIKEDLHDGPIADDTPAVMHRKHKTGAPMPHNVSIP